MTGPQAPGGPGDLAGRIRDRLAERPPALLIGDTAVTAATTRPTYDPSTGTVLAAVPVADPPLVQRAVAAAVRAQPDWYGMGLAARRTALETFGRAVADHLDELAMLDSMNGGNPYPAMVGDIRRGLHQFSTWPAVAGMWGGRTVGADPGDLHYTELMPYGVVARIVAYNHPAYFATKAILPPLAMGNTVVLKAAEQTPLSALRLAELAQGILPPGVLTVLAGDRDTGQALVRHPDVRRIGFTGSAGTGRAIQRSAAEVGVKNVSLELGGKNAMIVFPDAPVDQVAAAIVAGMNLDSCAGQSCGSTSRVFVHRDIHDAVVAAVADRLATVTPGVAYAPGAAMGPLVSAAHRDRVAGYVRIGLDAGARLVVGPRLPQDLPDGYYHGPVLFDRVEQSMRIANEEIFGPVIATLSWTDLDSALAQANSVPYGLTGSIWTNDLDRAMDATRRLHTGYVWVNTVGTHYWGVPFGGVKDSGIGREECIEELESYAEIKAVNVRGRRP